MAAPTFVGNYGVAASQSSASKTSTSFNASAGDVLVVCITAEGSGSNAKPGAVTNSGAALTWTLRQEYSTTNDWQLPYVKVYTAVVDTTRTGMTVTVAGPSGNMWWGMDVHVWTDTDGVGATNVANNGTGSGLPSVSLTTTQANSGISAIVADWNAASGSGVWASINGAAGTVTRDDFNSSYGAAHGARYNDAGAAGAKTVAMTSPSGQRYGIVAVEILGSAGGTTHDASGSASTTASTTATASKSTDGGGSRSASASLSAQAVGVRPAAGTLTATATLAADASVTTPPREIDGSLAGSATLAATGERVAPATGSASTTATTSSGAALSRPLDATLSVTSTAIADMAIVGPPVDVDGTLAVSASATTQATREAVVGGSRAVSAGLASTADRTATVQGSASVTASRSATAARTATVAGSLAGTAGLTADASVLGTVDVQGALSATATTAATAGKVVEVSGSLAVTATPTAAGTRTATVAGAVSATATTTGTVETATGLQATLAVTGTAAATAQRVQATGGTTQVTASTTADAEVILGAHFADGDLDVTATVTATGLRGRGYTGTGQATARLQATAEVRTPIPMEASLTVSASTTQTTRKVTSAQAALGIVAGLSLLGEVITNTWRFECPTYQRWTTPPPLIKRPDVALQRGISVIRISGVFTQVKAPTSEQLAAAGTEGLDYFLGGYAYEIPYSVAQELIAAGYNPTEI